MGLTALEIRNAQPRAKPYRLTDQRSLSLMVMPNGAKYWRFGYRFLDGQKTLALGVWPEVGLAEARDKRDAARRLIADGVDPMVEKKRKKLRAQIDASITFKSVAEDWVIKITRDGTQSAWSPRCAGARHPHSTTSHPTNAATISSTPDTLQRDPVMP
jgi:hypothetical protein